MSVDVRANVTPNLVLGICVTAVGVALALDQFQLIDARQLFRFWPLAVILFGASMVIQALRGGGDEASPAIRGRSSHANSRVWVLVFVGILVAQGLHRGRDTIQSDAGETVSLFAVMSRDQRTSSATRFQGGEMTSIMGESRLDLRQASIAPGEQAVIDVFTLMGGLVLQVPEGWTIDVQALPVMGRVNDRRGSRNRADGQALPEAETTGIEDRTPSPNAVAPPRVVLRGFIMMGGLVIRS